MQESYFPFLMGIGIFYFFPHRINIQIIGTTTFLMLIGAFIANFTYKKIYAYKGPIGVLIILLFFCLGAFICLLNKENLRTNHFTKKRYSQLKIWVNDEPQQSNHIMRF